MAHRLFEGKEHVALYWKYRISPSDQLIQQVVDFLGKQMDQPFAQAVDVGCGSGQGTILLANHFTSVVGTDVSPAQLEMALEHASAPNIKYRQCVAEELPFDDSSVDLVTAMSAFHWFDRPRFLQESHRILKPRGCVALINYMMDMELSYSNCCSHSLNQVCKEFYAALKPYRSAVFGPAEISSIELYRQAYESIPYHEKEWHDCVWVKKPMPLSSYMGLLESFTSYQALMKKDPQEAIRLSKDITQKLMSVMKVTTPETEVVVGIRYIYLVARKP